MSKQATASNSDQFWAYVRSVQEDVNKWPAWKKDAGNLLLEHTHLESINNINSVSNQSSARNSTSSGRR